MASTRNRDLPSPYLVSPRVCCPGSREDSSNTRVALDLRVEAAGLRRVHNSAETVVSGMSHIAFAEVQVFAASSAPFEWVTSYRSLRTQESANQIGTAAGAHGCRATSRGMMRCKNVLGVA